VEVDVLGSASPVAPESPHYLLRLPYRLPPLQGGCALDDHTVLVLMQGATGQPMLGKLSVNLSTGLLL